MTFGDSLVLARSVEPGCAAVPVVNRQYVSANEIDRRGLQTAAKSRPRQRARLDHRAAGVAGDGDGDAAHGLAVGSGFRGD